MIAIANPFMLRDGRGDAGTRPVRVKGCNLAQDFSK